MNAAAVATKTIGRNDPCYCGSGKKFKKCHGAAALVWRDTAAKLPFPHPQRDIVERTFFTAADDFAEHPLAGACHLLSSVLYVLLSEQGVAAELKLGVVRRMKDERDFTHSWVEIDGRIFDVAIQHMLNDDLDSPVFADIDVATGARAPYTYGINRELDEVGLDVQSSPLGAYMDECPFYPDGGWAIVSRIAARIGVKADIRALRAKYLTTMRTTVTGEQASTFM